YVVRHRFQQMLRSENREMRSRRVMTLFSCTTIYDIVERLSPNPKIVQQRTAFRRCPVDGDSLSLCFQIAEQLQQIAAQTFNFFAESAVELKFADRPCFLF